MSAIHLTLKEPPAVPLEAEAISPDALAEKPRDEIAALAVYLGKRRCRLDDFFTIEGDPCDDVHLHGDLRQVKWLGRGMTRGRLTVHGSAGMHLGAHMQGGSIEVHGDVGDWLGAEMKNGSIRVHGNAGGQVGAAYRGSLAGMRNGTIVIDGSAGLEVGMRMKKGTIVVGGRVKDFAGLQMIGGNIVLLAGAEIRTGAWMSRGTIISLVPMPLLPTFLYACCYNPPFLRMYAKFLAKLGVSLPVQASEGCYELYSGDMSVTGKGEILVWRPVASA